MIIIDQVIVGESAAKTASVVVTVQNQVNSEDSVVLILVPAGNANNSGTTFSVAAQYNGVNIPANVSQLITDTNNLVSGLAAAFLVTNPPVGSFPVTVTLTSSGTAGNQNLAVVVVTLLGVSKNTQTPIVASTTLPPSNTATSISLPIQNAIQNGVFFGILAEGDFGGGTSKITPPPSETQLYNQRFANSVALGVSYVRLSPSVYTSTWSITGFSGDVADAVLAGIILQPSDSDSIYHPTVQLRNERDTVQANGIDPLPPVTYSVGYHPSVFFQNSFLHTIGRVLSPPSGFTPIGRAAETERQTSQIIIDNVVQGQLAAQALSQVTLNLQINIPSSDSILVVTGGSVLAAGAPWSSVSFNGNSLIQLVQAIQTGADAEIWVMWNPPVGTYTLTIVSGTSGEIYANAMTLLGVDKTNTQVITASATDAASTSTITANIAADAANSVIIDTLSTLNATAQPLPDTSQNQVFNASALASNEYLLSTYKLSTNGPQNMNYNLQVAVNAALVAVAFRPAHQASMWFPNIDTRSLDDVVDANDLDAGTNPAFGNYGYKPSTFYLNSFVHTVGRMSQQAPAQIIARGGTLLLMGVG